MATYRIEWKTSAVKELKKIDRTIISRIIDAVDELGTEPLPSGVRKLQGSDHSYRIRVGDYRIVYEIKKDVLTVLIVKIRHRKDVYRP